MVGAEMGISLLAEQPDIRFAFSRMGPALLFSITATIVAIPAILLERKGLSIYLTIFVSCILLGIWLKSRYGPTFSTPTHYWTNVTGSEVVFSVGVLGGGDGSNLLVGRI